ESVTEGTVSRWLKQVGDTVETDEALLEISTDKVDTEIPSPASGTLTEIRVNEDETVEVGAVLGVIGSADGAVETAPEPETRPEPEAKPEPEPEPEPAQPQAAPEPARQEAAPSAAPPGQVAPARADGADGQYLTPLVRKLAAEHDVDLSSLTGTGVGGRIRKQDVLAAAEEAKKAAATPEPAAQPAAAAAPTQPTPEAAALRGTTEKVSRLRATIARRMVESLQTSAQLTATVEVDLTKISRLRAKVKNDFVSREGVKLSYLPFITKAVAETLKVYPKVNARIDTEAGVITYSDAENVGIAVDTAKGLVVPVIRDAGDLNIAGLAKKIADLADRSRSSKLAPDDLAGGTFTITNYGSAGTLMDTPIINQPQVAILGTGALVKRPVVMSDEDLCDTIVIRDMLYLSLSYYHRLVDGADAARFLSALKQRLEEADFTGELGR
ncbi:MAG: 2-oxoglutarate dehydrogenase, E2 component, dihydrolipoamide succinyltransferase, partial [Propionibacteriaceae bacterium]